MNVTKEHEVQQIAEFQQKGGKVFNIIYAPAKEVPFHVYQQSDCRGFAAMEWIRNLAHCVREWVLPSPVSPPTPVRATFSSVSWSADGVYLAAAFPDGSVHVYDRCKQQWLGACFRLEEPLSVHSLSWKPDCHHVIAIGSERGVALWQFHRDSDHQFISRQSHILQAAYSPNGE